MRIRWIVIGLLCWTGLFGQESSQPDAALEKLPVELRQYGAALLRETERAKLVAAVQPLLKDSTASMDFLLAVLDGDAPPALRSIIIDRLGRVNHSKVRQALRRHAESDPDPKLAVLALERLAAIEHQDKVRLLEARIKMAGQSGNEAERRWLLAEQERWLNLARGARVPAFMDTPPPLFSVKPANEPVRVLAFGDYGQGTTFQQQTAAGMLRYHRQHPFDFAITLGDNFYPIGMDSPEDPRWRTWWSQLYDPLGIRFYASLGNHDWGQPDSPAAEVIYSDRSPSWRMPATRYTFTAGAVQFFATDTQTMSPAQLLWLEEQLDRSQARWKVVYGHHPVYSHGVHGDTRLLLSDLLPVLKGRADVHLAGHEHDLQHLQPEGNLHFFIAGGGGARIRPITPGPRSLFARSSYGFAVLEADEQKLTVTFIDSDLKQLYAYTLRK